MYDNIGGKIKGLAKVIGIGGAVLSGLAFIICLIIAGAEDEWDTMAAILITLAVLVPVCIIASYPLYGFGELVEKVSKVADSKQFDPEQQGKVYYKDGRSTITAATIPAAPVVSNDLPEL